MTDVFTTRKRSWIMSRVRGRDTKPEIIVRSIIHRMGYRFSLHRRDLPGKPDVVLPRYRKIIVINGCFWHGHKNCLRSKRPSTHTKFWNRKLDKNIDRDKRSRSELEKMGWNVLVIWECEIQKPDKIVDKLRRYLNVTKKGKLKAYRP
jgi:DNA mismatch endonuclease (patch repair protein)